MLCLQEGKNILKVRPQSEGNEWGDYTSFTLFVDTKAPIINDPDADTELGDTQVTVSASSIVDDTSVTSDVSKLDWVKFRLSKDGGPFQEVTYNLGGVLSSPTLYHIFSETVESSTLLQWEISAQDIAKNVTVVTGYNLFKAPDGQLDITHIYDKIGSVDSGLVIGHPGLGIIETGEVLGVIPTDPIRETSLNNFLTSLSVIQTDDYFESDQVITLQDLANAGIIQTTDISSSTSVITTEHYLQILSIISTSGISGSDLAVQLAALENAGVIQLDNIEDTSQATETSEIGGA
jgi:hypothetical protein